MDRPAIYYGAEKPGWIEKGWIKYWKQCQAHIPETSIAESYYAYQAGLMDGYDAAQ